MHLTPFYRVGHATDTVVDLFPAWIHERLRERARADRRTFSSEVLLLVQRGLTVAEEEEAEVERLVAVYHATVIGSS